MLKVSGCDRRHELLHIHKTSSMLQSVLSPNRYILTSRVLASNQDPASVVQALVFFALKSLIEVLISQMFRENQISNIVHPGIISKDDFTLR